MQVELSTKNLELKTANEDDIAKIIDYFIRNKSFLEQWEPKVPDEFYNHEFHKQFVNKKEIDIDKINNIRFWIYYKGNNDKIIGTVSLSNIVRGGFLSCFLGYKLDKDEINKGLMTEALQACIKFAFDEMKLHRIEANIIPRNKASIRVVEKIGFYEEGIATKYLKINGKWEDHIHMVIRNKKME